MRTRSSRFFVVLLHLMSCQYRHLFPPSSSSSNSNNNANSKARVRRTGGIVGVHPWPIVLEHLDVDQLLEQHEYEPIWLQDDRDGQCLGPTATFGPCGDATLWFVTKLRGKLRMGMFGVEEQNPAVQKESAMMALRVLDDYDSANKKRRWYHRRRRPRPECLAIGSSLHHHHQQQHPSNGKSSSNAIASNVGLETCTTKFSSKWAWHVSADGILQNVHRETSRCLYRQEGNQKVVLDDCHHPKDRHLRQTGKTDTKDGKVDGEDNDGRPQPTKISFVRFRAVAKESSTESSTVDNSSSDTASASSASSTPQTNFSTRPRHKATSEHHHPHASDNIQLISTNKRFDASASSSTTTRHRPGKKLPKPFSALHNTNPLLLAHNAHQRQQFLQQQQQPIENSNSLRMRPIQVHPYIETAKDEVWTDPETGLEFRTDLCRYLGHSRPEKGRHTLMGVGQYKKFVVKVYGVAYYVSKRDVLNVASSVFRPFASLSAAELRQRPDFYHALRTMADPDSNSAFDRTLMIKTNMQLASDTIRSSLHADWTMLTSEAKTLLIGTSIRPRPADERMLEIIQSAKNPSRCSCSQEAPEEYKADPACCARGTELAFTWTKEGTLEVRLNGRVMEIFDRPDIAEGIFYEYFRTDDPMSYSLIERVVDGFPFLLGPLAQVQGFQSSSSQAGHKLPREKTHQQLVKALTGGMDVVTSQVMGAAGQVQRLSAEAVGHSVQGLKNAGDGAQHMLKEMDRRREWVLSKLANVNVKEIVEKTPETVVRLMTQDKAETIQEVSETIQEVSEWVSVMSEEDSDDENQTGESSPLGFPLSRWFGEIYYAPDEIGPMIIHPSHSNLTRKIFLALVHLYLLLLFIVSFPGSYNTRTRLVVRKSSSKSNGCGLELSDSDESSSSDNTHKIVENSVRRPNGITVSRVIRKKDSPITQKAPKRIHRPAL